MRKYMVLCAGLCLATAFTSCGSKESAYRKMFDKAQAQEAAQTYTAPEQNAPVVVTPVQTTSPDTKTYDNVDNVKVTQERVSLVSGSGLKNFSVVVGSFGVKANAEREQQKLKDAGYDAQIVKNDERNMYRLVAATFDNKIDAARSRDQFRATYPDAWLLYNAQ